jgi:heat shock protein HslJ
MDRHRTIAFTLILLLVGSPGAVAAQEEEALTTPEGADWTLTSYVDETSGEPTPVPFEVRPTLRLEDGVASGFGGCNQFSGDYALDGASLTLSDELSVTLAFCEGPGQAVEDAYLAGLGNVDGWSVEGEVLQLHDGLGQTILTFEVPTIMWAPSQLASLLATLAAFELDLADLQAEMGALRDDTDALNVPALRQRIRTLESENARLQERVESLEDRPTEDPPSRPPDSASFSAAERVLLRGIPTRIANRCRPRRSSLPKGTRAAVTCTPNSNIVASVDYYLLEGSRAANAFGNLMENYNVEEALADGRTCGDGVKSQRYWIGGGWQAEGCYRENQRAQLRFVDNATDCRRLRVGGATIPSPAFYIALQGTNNDVSRLHDWATRNLDEDSSRQLTSITRFIPSNLGISPSCPT